MMEPRTQAFVGAGLFTTPWVVDWVQSVSLLAGMVTAVCGAILGIHAVWRLHKRGWK